MNISPLEDSVDLSPPKVDSLGRSYGTGRRKAAIARVWVKVGTGKFIVNNKSIDSYLQNGLFVFDVLSVLRVASSEGKYDIYSTVKGGGLSGQAGALRHGLAKAMKAMIPSLHRSLRAAGLLTRDSRVVERKKYGQHKARKKYQFSKR